MTDNAFDKKAKELLDESVDGLDGPTLSKLHRARSNAVARAGQTTPSSWLGWTTAGAVAASLAVAAIYIDRQPPPLPSIYEDELQQAAAEDMELLDDLDFIAWLVLEEGELSDEIDRS